MANAARLSDHGPTREVHGREGAVRVAGMGMQIYIHWMLLKKYQD